MIDTTFDFRAEAKGRDIDRYSPTLQNYHQKLWSKPLPSGQLFDLTKISQNRLYHKSDLGEFYVSSDRAITSFWKRAAFQHMSAQFTMQELLDYDRILDSIGGMMIWPSNKIGTNLTINAARGFNHLISDRLDLTIECIRRYYRGEPNPLLKTFQLYDDFFALFNNFEGYVSFFLLQDAVSSDFTQVKICPPFDTFETSPVPKNIEEFLQYKAQTTEFVSLRNQRIQNAG